MKCPKCGYLGFETTDRCRNCGYDFSLASAPPPAELPLRGRPRGEPLADFRLRDDADEGVDAAEQAPGGGRESAEVPPHRVAPDPPAGPGPAPMPPAADPAADLPLFAPRPAGTPLAVRRPGHEVPKARRTTTRPVRRTTPSLPLAPETARGGVEKGAAVSGYLAAEPAGLGARLLAAAVDLTLLVAVDAVVVRLTLLFAGLQPTLTDLRVIRPAPMAGFFLVMALVYLAGFTVGGGQTIGKMLTGIRVTGDDGRGVDLTGAVVRALGCLAAVVSLGVLFVPAVFSADRRAVHDRLAGTRVVMR